MHRHIDPRIRQHPLGLRQLRVIARMPKLVHFIQPNTAVRFSSLLIIIQMGFMIDSWGETNATHDSSQGRGYLNIVYETSHR